MFSTTNSSVDPFTQPPSSSFHPTPYFHDQYTTNDTLLYHLHNPLTIPFMPTNPSITGTELNMEVSSNAMMTKLDLHALNEDQYDPSNFHPRNGPVKKDRHSKIYTSRGLRDRRVRLSIEIARKFFDLQDMLGFDRASETLDWLFTKSRKAIKELAESASAKSLSSSSACEVVSEKDGLDGITSKIESLPAGVFEEGKMKQEQKSSVNLLGRESRARARARARERTRVKMTSRTLHLNDFRNCSDSCHCCLNQVPRSLNHHQECEKSGACCHSMASSPGVVQEVEGYTSDSHGNQMPKANVIKESMVLERKFMKPSLGIHYQQNPELSRGTAFDFGCCSSNNDLNTPNLAQVWDINSAVAHSSICAVTNMNLSTELQLYGKIWEAERNRCPR